MTPWSSARKTARLVHTVPAPRTVCVRRVSNAPARAPVTAMRRAMSIRSSPGVAVMSIMMASTAAARNHHRGRPVADSRCHFQAFLRGPDVLVVKEWNDAYVVAHHLHRLPQDGFALGGIELGRSGVECVVDRRAAITAPVRRTNTLLWIDGAENVDERIACFARTVAPGNHAHRKLVLVRTAGVTGPRHDLDLRLHPNARPELRHGLRRFGCLRITVVRHAKRQLEAVRKTRFGQQLLGLDRVVGDVLHVRVVAEGLGWHPLV